MQIPFPSNSLYRAFQECNYGQFDLAMYNYARDEWKFRNSFKNKSMCICAPHNCENDN